MRALAATLLVACGSPHGAAPDGATAATDAPAATCTAAWSGNFTEVATGSSCATMSGSNLALTAPAMRLPAPLPIAIDLAAPVAGSYTPSTVGAWSANEVLMILGNSCAFEAGSMVAPPGDFTLSLTDAAAPHGTLALDLAVLAEQESTCGSPLTEHLELTF